MTKAETEYYKTLTELEKAFYRAIHQQPYVGRLAPDTWLVMSTSREDYGYRVTLVEDKGCEGATCECKAFVDLKRSYCTHIAAAFLAANDLLGVMAEKIDARMRVQSASSLQPVVLPQQCQHCHKDLSQVEVELNMTECKQCLDETLVA